MPTPTPMNDSGRASPSTSGSWWRRPWARTTRATTRAAQRPSAISQRTSPGLSAPGWPATASRQSSRLSVGRPIASRASSSGWRRPRTRMKTRKGGKIVADRMPRTDSPALLNGRRLQVPIRPSSSPRIQPMTVPVTKTVSVTGSASLIRSNTGWPLNEDPRSSRGQAADEVRVALDERAVRARPPPSPPPTIPAHPGGTGSPTCTGTQTCTKKKTAVRKISRVTSAQTSRRPMNDTNQGGRTLPPGSPISSTFTSLALQHEPICLPRRTPGRQGSGCPRVTSLTHTIPSHG